MDRNVMKRVLVARVRHRTAVFTLLFLCLFVSLGGLLLLAETPSVAAFQPPDTPAPTHPPTDLACAMCHSDTTAVHQFPSGESMSVQVDLAVLAASVHGQSAATPLACADCHQTVNDYQFPHAPVEAESLRAYQIEQAITCERCHQRPHITNHPGWEAAMPVTCTDCHGGHSVRPVAAWHSGEAVGACVDCHLQADVQPADPDRLLPLIRNGLFADEPDTAYCLSCHSQPDLTMTFPNGDVKALTVDEDAFHASVHGLDNPWQPLQCRDCHGDYIYPHPAVTTESAREFTIAMNGVCEACHVQSFEKTLDSVHAAALQEGNLDAAVCTDCHGAHETQPPGEPLAAIPQTCGNCHSTIYEEYAASVHGTAVITDNNPDAPTCIACHAAHDIQDPSTVQARARSPELCAECHANTALMTEYDISTDVFETYVADFHGTTVMLFDYEHEDVPPNTAVCYDCHGVHNIQDTDDPNANISANLVENCRQCHPDANTNFAGAWLNHYRPSLQHYPVIFLVDLFYKIVIPVTIGFFGLMIGSDVYRRVRLRWQSDEPRPDSSPGKPAA
jgi:predicted CXXCH cytochrome family protein